MITGGIETLLGVVQEPVFGPVVVFGTGGVAADVLADYAARLAPLTDADAEDLIRSVRSAPGRCAISCSVSPGWPMTCPRSPSLTSTRQEAGTPGPWSVTRISAQPSRSAACISTGGMA